MSNVIIYMTSSYNPMYIIHRLEHIIVMNSSSAIYKYIYKYIYR